MTALAGVDRNVQAVTHSNDSLVPVGDWVGAEELGCGALSTLWRPEPCQGQQKERRSMIEGDSSWQRDGHVPAQERLPPDHPDGIKNLQLGCGPQHIRRDWWNTDLRAFPGIDEALDAVQEWRWIDQLHYVYAEHFLEHLDISQAVAVLANCARSLRRGGVVRMSTPSLEWVLKSHFGFLSPTDSRQVSETIAVNRAFHGWGHKFLYSQGMLAWLFENMGFENVEFFSYGESNHETLRNLELHGGWQVQHGFPSVWIVEATPLKPASGPPPGTS